ncbi:MAG: phosphate signaling complex protein PhoU [Zoogloeaceae bacterium]|nr:phosphate signaling complex protein PhoU [Zoogloeaceae bacterium]
MNKHIFAPFDRDLDELRQRVVLMGQEVCQQVRDAIRGLGESDTALIEQVILRDKRINREEIDLDERCVQIIVKHAPAAADLRMLTTTMQMITDLERVGDEAKKIAKAARQIVGADRDTVPAVNLLTVSEHAVMMLERALDAYVRGDISVAPQLAREDKDVDAVIKGIMSDLATDMMKSPELVIRSLDLLTIAKAIERVGDHATNVAEYVVFMARGRDVRHSTPEAMEQVVHPAR